MRKRKKGRRFSRNSDQRRAFLRHLGNALILKEKVRTTEARAKEISGFVEKRITLAKLGEFNSRRLLSRDFSNKIVKKLVDDVAKRYKERKGGYTRIIKLGQRKSDGAKMAIIELVK